MSGLRTALFIDYENLANALKPRPTPKPGAESTAASSLRLDFERLVRAVQKRYGSLDADDVIVVGDFRRHSRQSTGLSQLANLVDINTYEVRAGRAGEAYKAGMKAQARNAGNVTLAFYVGVHVARRSAEVYLLLSGDSALSAVADELARLGKQVAFIIPGDVPSPMLADRFNCIPFSELYPPDQAPLAEDAAALEVETQPSPGDEIVAALSTLHREFTGSGIPAALLRAMLGPGKAQRLLNRARNENAIDLWKDPAGVECASLYRMRLGGKAVVMPARSPLPGAAMVLFEIAKATEGSNKVWTRAEWRKLIKEKGGFSSNEAKRWLEALLEAGILRDAALNRPDFRLEKLVKFLHKIEL